MILYLEHKVGTLTKCGLIRGINWRLFGELGVKLRHVIIT